MNIDFIGIPIEYLEKMFDIVRVIDFKNKKVIIDNINRENKIENKTCYDMLDKYDTCENCMPSKAYYENDTFTKFEYIKDKLFLVMTTPIMYGKEKYILEALKDISSSIFIYDEQFPQTQLLTEHIKRINKLAVKDELTDIYNRRYLNEGLAIDITKSLKNNLDLSVAMIDIDYFKKINDSYHHIVGDYVLKDFVSIISNNIRSDYDWIARYGGEEFVVVFRNTDIKEAASISERIRKAVEKYNFKYDDININLTASFGVSSISNEINSSSLILEKADEQLYKAKENGRNRVESA